MTTLARWHLISIRNCCNQNPKFTVTHNSPLLTIHRYSQFTVTHNSPLLTIHRYSQFTVTHNNILRGTAAMLSRMFCFNSSMFLGYRNPQLSCAAARNSHLRSTGSETNAELLLQTPFCFTDIYITSGRYSVDHHSMVRK